MKYPKLKGAGDLTTSEPLIFLLAFIEKIKIADRWHLKNMRSTNFRSVAFTLGKQRCNVGLPYCIHIAGDKCFPLPNYKTNALSIDKQNTSNIFATLLHLYFIAYSL